MNASSRRGGWLLVALGLGAGLLAGGCGSVSSLDLPSLTYSQTRAFEVETDQLYAASEAVLTDMHYTHVRGSRATGRLEWAARVNPSATLNARQRNVEIVIREIATGESELRITFREAIEDTSAGETVTATNRVIRDGTIYQVFWERLAEKLGVAPPPPQAGEP